MPVNMIGPFLNPVSFTIMPYGSHVGDFENYHPLADNGGWVPRYLAGAMTLPWEPGAGPPMYTGGQQVSGPTSGGTTVTIAGTGFMDPITGVWLVKDVEFGNTPALSFTVTSTT